MRALVVGLVLSSLAVAHADGVTEHGSGQSFDPQSVYRVPRGQAPSEGPVNAPVTIVAWSDYACGYCNRVQDTLDRLGRLFPGQIRFVHRTLPLDAADVIGPEAALAAAAQGRFRPMHDRLFALHGRVDRVAVELIARELGLDMLRFRADLDAGTYRPLLVVDVRDAIALGVTGTPTFFVNGRPLHGSQGLDVFVAAVEQGLADAAQVRAQHGGEVPDIYDALVATGKPTADAPAETTNERGQLDARSVYRIGFGLPNQQLGSDKALVTIVEFSDFECPYCARQAPVLAKLRDKYGDQLRIVFRHYPVLFHRDSMIAAEAGAAAADQGKFWAFHDQVFSNFGKLSRADLESYAKAAGLDLARFRAALDARTFHDAVIAEGSAAEALGVSATPTLFINGRPVIGMRDQAALERIIDATLDYVHAAMTRGGLSPADVFSVLMSDAKGQDRADPSAIPESPTLHVEMRDEDRGLAIEAACRRRDPTRAVKLLRSLAGEPKRRAVSVCAGEGIDLP